MRPGAVPPVDARALERQPRARAVENVGRRAHHPIPVSHQLLRVPPEEEPPVVAVPPSVRPVAAIRGVPHVVQRSRAPGKRSRPVTAAAAARPDRRSHRVAAPDRRVHPAPPRRARPQHVRLGLGVLQRTDPSFAVGEEAGVVRVRVVRPRVVGTRGAPLRPTRVDRRRAKRLQSAPVVALELAHAGKLPPARSRVRRVPKLAARTTSHEHLGDNRAQDLGERPLERDHEVAVALQRGPRRRVFHPCGFRGAVHDHHRRFIRPQREVLVALGSRAIGEEEAVGVARHRVGDPAGQRDVVVVVPVRAA